MGTSVEQSTQAINKIEQASYSFNEISTLVSQMKGHIARITSTTDLQCTSADIINNDISGIKQSAK